MTGANSGVGYATAKYLAERSADYHIIVGTRSLENGERAVADIQAGPLKGSVSTVQLDVTDESSIAAAVTSVQKNSGRVDVLINNAGISSKAESLKDQLTACLVTNAIGATLVTNAFKDLLLKSSNPRLLHISSGLGSIAKAADPKDPYAFVTSYSYQMSKAAMDMAAVLDHRTYAPKGVRVWALCPGFVESNLRGKDRRGLRCGCQNGGTAGIDKC